MLTIVILLLSTMNSVLTLSYASFRVSSGRGICHIPRVIRPWSSLFSTTTPAPPPSPTPFFNFTVVHTSSKSSARVCRITTPHGVIDTPTFVAVGTNAALKGLDYPSADEAGQQLTFANTYHLMLQPGADVIGEAGGLNKFTGREGPFITDSGGFQVFSLAYGKNVFEGEGEGEGEGDGDGNGDGDGDGGELKRRSYNKNAAHMETRSKQSSMVNVTEDGVIFRSYRDGTSMLLTPESCVQAQKKLGASIIIPLDELPPYQTDRSTLEASLHRSHRWELRSLREHLKDRQNQAMYCVVHGGVDLSLRLSSLRYLTSLSPGFDGIAIGGSLGNTKSEMLSMLGDLMPHVPRDRPAHLLGIADVESIEGCVPLGLDSFDSAYPTRLARHGTLLTRGGKLHIKNRANVRAFGVKVDEECKCRTCREYDRAYLNHLLRAKEPVFLHLATRHNVHFMNDYMKKIREKIMNDEI